LRSAFADLHFDEQDIIASSDRVAAILTMSGTHVGDYAGIAPTGRTFSYPQVHIFRIADSKVVEHRAVRDDLKLMIQLGVIGPALPQYEHVFQSWKNSIMR
jgi:predicted ester cyclase